MTRPFIRLLVVVMSGALYGGCSSGLGDFCYQDKDCTAGLRCSARDDQRGICTYPEGVPDLSPVVVDRGQDTRGDQPLVGEQGPGDSSLDLADTVVVSDQGTVDIPADQPGSADLGPDAATRDQGIEAAGDGAVGDLIADTIH